MSESYNADRGSTRVSDYQHPSRPLISDERLVAATGRSRKDWFKALDQAGAQEWDHAHIARWLGGKQDVDAWWAQSVTVDYEYSRGLRIPGQKSDGLFSANVSKTLRHSPDTLWPLIDDDDARRSWLDCEFEVRGRTPLKSLRMEASDGSRIAIALYALKPSTSGVPRTRVDVTHSHMAHADDLPETLAFWKAALEALIAVTAEI